MVNNRAILGFFVILLLIIGAVLFFRRNPNLFSRVRNTTNQVGTTATPTSAAGTPATTSPVTGSNSCSADVLNQTCSDQPENIVCGVERIVAENGTETTRSLQYRNACSYCKLYGQASVLDLGDTKYYPLGFTPGACGATK